MVDQQESAQQPGTEQSDCESSDESVVSIPQFAAASLFAVERIIGPLTLDCPGAVLRCCQPMGAELLLLIAPGPSYLDEVCSWLSRHGIPYSVRKQDADDNAWVTNATRLLLLYRLGFYLQLHGHFEEANNVFDTVTLDEAALASLVDQSYEFWEGKSTPSWAR